MLPAVIRPWARRGFSGLGRLLLLLAGLGGMPVAPGRAQGADLALTRLVQLAPGTRPLGVVLADLARQGHLPLSYSSSLVPVAHRCRRPAGPARPVGEVLREVLAAEHLSFGWLAGQLVVSPIPVAVLVARATAPASAALVGTVGAANGSAVNARAGGRRTLIKRPSRSVANAVLVARPQLRAAIYRSPKTRNLRPLPLPKRGNTATQLVLESGSKTRLLLQPGSVQNWVRRPGRRGNASVRSKPAPALISLSANTVASHSNTVLPISSGTGRGGVVPLGPTATLPESLPEFGKSSLPSAAPGPADPPLSPGQIQSAGSVTAVADGAKKSPAPAGWPRSGYLHGEGWVGESLPVSAALKVGISRVYLVLGVAVGPPDHQSGGVAGGVGLGSAGRPRGRFTPSLDLMQWFLSGDQGTPGARLTQLRPLLAWQMKPGGRGQVFGGPTLNLGTGGQRGPGPPRGAPGLGQTQWLWLDSGDEHSFWRLWPGVQLGLRF